jgi:hypothetical protein
VSDFVSVHNVIFGNRPAVFSEVEQNRRHIQVQVRADQEPVDIKMVASAAELDKIFCFDDFGRFGLANDEQRDKVLGELKVYCRLCAYSNTDELDRYEDKISDPAEFSEWHMFGWLIGDLPDFEACYQQWKTERSTSGKEPILKRKRLDDPRTSNTVWDMVKGLLTAVINEHLTSESKTANDIIAELMSKSRSAETMRLLKKLQHIAPDSFTMDERTFRSKLKDIFSK